MTPAPATRPCPANTPAALWQQLCRAVDDDAKRLGVAFVKVALGAIGMQIEQ